MKARYWLGLSLGAVAGLGVAGYAAIQPTFKPATDQELKGTLPPEVLRVATRDLGAENRDSQMASLGQGLLAAKTDESGALTNKDDIHRQNGPILRLAGSLLAQGPLRTASDQSIETGFPKSASLKALAKAFSYEAAYVGERHESKRCADLLILNLHLGDAAMNTHGKLIDVLVAIACKAIALKSTATATRKGYLDPTDLKRVLDAIPPTTPSNPELADALRAEWRGVVLDKTTGLSSICAKGTKALAENEGHAMVGNFDALETAKQFAGLYSIEISNAMQPWTKQDQGLSKYADLAKELPQDPNPSSFDGDKPPDTSQKSKLEYEVRMNRIPNSVGKILVSEIAGIDGKSSCVGLASNTELVRTLIAIQIYKGSHAGSAPNDLAELVSNHYLNAIPTDRFSEKPLRYDRARGIVYSVGTNGIDDGGVFENEGQPLQPDIGYHLIQPKPKPAKRQSIPGFPAGQR